MGSPGVGGAISAASDTQISTPVTDDLFIRNSSSRWQNVALTEKAAQVVGGGVEKVVTANITGAATIALANGNVFNLTLTGNVTSLNFTGATAGRACAVTVYFKQGGTARTLAWTLSSGTLKWAGGTAPTITATANAIDCCVFESIDGGTTWFGSLVGQNFS